MRNLPLLLALSLLLADVPAWSLDSYVMDVRVNLAEHTLSGSSVITWTNPDSVPVSELRLHLYPNAFEGTGTTLWRESPFLKNWESLGEEAFGRLTIREARLDGHGRPLELRFDRPDDANPHDRTVGVLPLPAPVAPGEMVVLRLAWETKLHRYFFRSGYSADSLFLMQWYPKLGVLADGKWNCHQFHSFTEFYSDFADYAVTLRLPTGWTVVGTGAVTERAEPEGGVRVELSAENVHDVAVVASRSMKKITRERRPRQGDAVKITLFLPEEYAYKQSRIFSALERVFAFMEEWAGPYLWDQFTTVVPSWPTAQGHGGMEYPQLIVSGLRHFSSPGDPDLDYVLTHEFIHQYFYGMIATDEVEHPWMDEGFTTYLAVRCLDAQNAVWRPDLRLMGLPIPLKPYAFNPEAKIHLNYYADEGMEEMGKPGWMYASYRSYRANAYNKPALTLATLEHYAGEDAMKTFLRDYFSKYAFAHPGPKEVLDLVSEHFGSHWAALLDHLLKKPSRVDYRVLNADAHSCTIGYAGDIVLPVEVRVGFSDGSLRTFVHDSRDRVRRYEFSDKTVVSVEVDPGRRLVLDTDPRNNTLRLDAGFTPSLGALWARAAHLMEQCACLF